MNHEPIPQPLQPALARLKADLATRQAPPLAWRQAPPLAWPQAVAAAQPALATAGAPPAARGPGAAGRAVLFLGAAALSALVLAWLLRPLPAAPPPAGADNPASGFLPVAPPERFATLWQAGGDTAAAWVVRTELPRERLAAFGLPYDPARAGEPVRAELLMHPAGDVLAVRLTP